MDLLSLYPTTEKEKTMQKRTLFQRILLTSVLSLSCLSMLAGCLSPVSGIGETMIPETTIEETEPGIQPLDDINNPEIKIN